jgi:hypothetical protein
LSFTSRGVFLGRCDLRYPQFAVLIGFDGVTNYLRSMRSGEDPSTVVIREKLREDALAEAGYVVMRIVWADLREPHKIAARISAAIERGSRSLAAGIVTGSCAPLDPITVAA